MSNRSQRSSNTHHLSSICSNDQVVRFSSSYRFGACSR